MNSGIIVVGSIFGLLVLFTGAPLWVAWVIMAGTFALAFLDERLGK